MAKSYIKPYKITIFCIDTITYRQQTAIKYKAFRHAIKTNF